MFDRNNLVPIPDGALLYTCRIEIAPGAAGSFPLDCQGAAVFSPGTQPVVATCTSGAVEVQ